MSEYFKHVPLLKSTLWDSSKMYLFASITFFCNSYSNVPYFMLIMVMNSYPHSVFQVFAQVCCALGAFCLVKQFYTMVGLHQTHCWFSSYISLPIHLDIRPRVYLSCIFWLSSLISNLIHIHLCTNLFVVVRWSIKKNNNKISWQVVLDKKPPSLETGFIYLNHRQGLLYSA